ncbi:DUF4185 domain-containing protein [Tomitella cavernea]|uniref:DUF4185 domain-containing protein n=1 Tax=Tomitella cavernea TaxID=1387982 RepID=A0ABP9C6D1_9ACTN|nr:DUF4185 domain-containing protein [Tomitella cavernea]
MPDHPYAPRRTVRRPATLLAGAVALGTCAALSAAPAGAAPVDNGSMGSITDQSSLDGTPLGENGTQSLGSAGSLSTAGSSALGALTAPLEGGGSLSSLASTGLSDSFGGGSLGCALGSTGVTGSGSVGSSGGPMHSVPWLNGQDGMLPQVNGITEAVAHITGPSGTNSTVPRFNVIGTDLGIMWDNGSGQTLLAFGDTTGANDDPVCNGLVGHWRSNVLLRSDDDDLSDGMSIDSAAMASPGQAKEILPSLKVPGVEHTVIPTAGIAVPHAGAAGGFRQYVEFMSVKSWGAPGEWTTNYSALAYSDDNGENWVTPTFGSVPDMLGDAAAPGTGAKALRTATAAMSSVRLNAGGNANFQMGAFVRTHDADVGDPDSYVYFFGTPSGRSGSARLSRVQQKDIENAAAYTYWDGAGWAATPEQAAVVIDGKVSELSVAYNTYLGKYIAMYTHPVKGLVVRTADSLTGPWSGTTTLISPLQVPAFYGAFMHPESSDSDSRYLYFTGTTWSDYNVMLLRTDLSALRD